MQGIQESLHLTLHPLLFSEPVVNNTHSINGAFLVVPTR